MTNSHFEHIFDLKQSQIFLDGYKTTSDFGLNSHKLLEFELN